QERGEPSGGTIVGDVLDGEPGLESFVDFRAFERVGAGGVEVPERPKRWLIPELDVDVHQITAAAMHYRGVKHCLSVKGGLCRRAIQKWEAGPWEHIHDGAGV